MVNYPCNLFHISPSNKSEISVKNHSVQTSNGDKGMHNQNNPVGDTPVNSDRIQELHRQIDELKKNWPAHSIPAAMLQRLDELEGELVEEQNKL